MIADLIALGVFSERDYGTPAARTIIIPVLNVNGAPRAFPSIPPKYSDEIIDYKIDWTAVVGGDAITASSVVTIVGDAEPTRMIFNGPTCAFFVGGGTPESLSRLKCEVTTMVGRTFEFVLQIQILAN